jgi:hypothetical protein
MKNRKLFLDYSHRGKAEIDRKNNILALKVVLFAVNITVVLLALANWLF